MTVNSGCSIGLRIILLLSTLYLSPQAHSTAPAYLADEGLSLGISLGYGQLDNPVYNKGDIPLYVLPRVELFVGDFSFANTQLTWTPITRENYQLSVFTQLNEDGLYFAKHSAAFAAIRTTTGRPSMGSIPPAMGDMPPTTQKIRGDIGKISNRKLSIMTGAEALYDWQNWRFSVSWAMELTNYHKGLQGALSAQRLYKIDQHLLLLGIEVQHLNRGLVDYYYGTSQQDVQVGFSRFEGRSSQKYGLKATYQYHFSQQWQFISDVKYQRLSSGIADSPLINDSNLLSFYAGIAWNY